MCVCVCVCAHMHMCVLVCMYSVQVGATGKEPACHCKGHKRCRFNPWVGKIPWRAWLHTPVFLPGELHGPRSLVGYSLWGHKELDMTEMT